MLQKQESSKKRKIGMEIFYQEFNMYYLIGSLPPLIYLKF